MAQAPAIDPEVATTLAVPSSGTPDVSVVVTIFNEATPADLIHAVRPDVLVKGADYQKHQVVGAEFVESYGGRVHLAQLRDGFSTTQIIQKMKVA